MEKQKRNAIGFLIVFGIVAVVATWTGPLESRYEPGLELSAIPRSFAGWQGTDLALTASEAKGTGDGTTLKRRYEKNGHAVRVVTVVPGETHHNVHHPIYCYTASGWSVREVVRLATNASTRVRLVRSVDGKERRSVELFWFIDGKRIVAGYNEQLFRNMQTRMARKALSNWSLVRFSCSEEAGHPELADRLLFECSEDLRGALGIQP